MTRFEDHYAEVNGIRMHYVSAGSGDLILFLHGFPEFWGEWEEQLKEFGKDHLAVAPDLRGYNLTSRPPDPASYHIKLLVEDIRALAGHLGSEKFTLVAHDWGGGVAWSFANRHPELLERLMIINSPHPAVFARELLQNPAQREASQYMVFFQDPGAEKILEADGYAYLLEALFGSVSKWPMTQALKEKYVAAWSRPGALTGGLNYYRASPLHPPRNAEEEALLRGIAEAPREMFAVKAPTLVLWGEEDHALLPGNLEGLQDYVEDLTIHRIPGATHWVVHERPEEVNTAIRAFLEETPKA